MAGSYYSDPTTDLDLSADRLIELTDTSAAPGVADQATIDRAGREAQRIIDSALVGVYVVPFPQGQVPLDITRLHADIHRYLLFKHRDVLSIPESVADEYKLARADLDDYSTPDGGKILIGASMAGSGTAPGSTVGAFSSDVDDTRPAARRFGSFKDGLG
jgi:phage gp36-like protein